MQVVIVPCLFDNYAYLAVDEASAQATIVDPSETKPILDKIASLGLTPAGVLCTHHHADHVDGLDGILTSCPNLPVCAHERDEARIAGVTHTVRDQEEVQLGGIAFRALHTPGHTLGALTWLAEGCAFTGDTLFVGGCGRVFEGTAKMMHESLHDVIGALDLETRIYCGHEYTLTNLRFAKHVERGNEAVERKLFEVESLRANKEPTVPSTLFEERATNPFLRCTEPAVVDFARKHDAGGVDPVSVFAAVRAAKNQFRG